MLQTTTSPTLDGLFRRVLARRPDALALVDPADKARITGQPPRQLSFAQADRAIDALAAHFIAAGLPPNSVIALHLPNTIEFPLAVLAAHRAGIKKVVLPEKNSADLAEIPETVQKEMEFILVKNMSDVIKHALEKEASSGKNDAGKDWDQKSPVKKEVEEEV